MHDAWDALDAQAGIVDPAPIARARALAESVADAERAWRGAMRQRDAAVREAAAANPRANHAKLGREVGLAGEQVSSIVNAARAA